MPLDPRFKGRSYGPSTYVVGLEKIREFATAISSAALPYYAAAAQDPRALRPIYHDESAGRASPHGSVIAPPTFCVNFAITPFLQAVTDPELGIQLPLLLHGEQAFEFHTVVRPDDRLTTHGTITDLYERAQKDFLIVTSESTNQHGDLVVRGVWTAVIRQS